MKLILLPSVCPKITGLIKSFSDFTCTNEFITIGESNSDAFAQYLYALNAFDCIANDPDNSKWQRTMHQEISI